MALWGKSDNIASAGIVTLTYATKTVTGEEHNSKFGLTGFAQTGDIIRLGFRGIGGTYFGDAVITSIASSTSLTIGSTSGLALNGPSIAGTSYHISELPISTVGDVTYSEISSGTDDKLVYGAGPDVPSRSDKFHIAHAGWVGVTTYTDMHGNARVKTEVLVANSGITTGSNGIDYPTPQ